MSGWQDGLKDKATSATKRSEVDRTNDAYKEHFGKFSQPMPAVNPFVHQPPKLFHVQIDYPPSANVYWRTTKTGRVYVSPEARAYKKAVGLRFAGRKPLLGPVALSLNVFRPRKSGDLGNRLKVLEDALEGYAYVNDSQVVEIHMWRGDDKFNPRVVVKVTPA